MGSPEPNELKGIPVSRWIDGVLENKDNMDQPDNVRGMVFWGHAPNSQTRLKEMKAAMEKLDIMVVIDPYPTVSAVCQIEQMGFIYFLRLLSTKHMDQSPRLIVLFNGARR